MEPVKEIFLQGSRAKKEFIEANDSRKRTIVEKLLWNLSIENGIVASIQYKKPFDVIAKAPKYANSHSLLGDMDSNHDIQDQNLKSYH